jgi:hypothetical protein
MGWRPMARPNIPLLPWCCLPFEARQRLLYMEQLLTNLFISLPDSTKRAFIRHAHCVLKYPTFVETGTFLGKTALHASRYFQTVHTIELSPWLVKRALDVTGAAPNVFVHEGNSGKMLRSLLPTISTSCIFWLDGHFSGGVTAKGETDTPIIAELEAIADHHVRPHAVLIDDARVFGTDDAYPTLEKVIMLLRRIDASFKIGISSDIIWAAPVKLLNFEWQVSHSGFVLPPTTAISNGSEIAD